MYTDVASGATPNITSTTKVPSTTTQTASTGTSTNGTTTPTTSTTISSNGNGTYLDNGLPKREKNGMLERSLYVVGYNQKLATYNLYYQCYLIMQAYAPHAAKKPNEVSICRL